MSCTVSRLVASGGWFVFAQTNNKHASPFLFSFFSSLPPSVPTRSLSLSFSPNNSAIPPDKQATSSTGLCVVCVCVCVVVCMCKCVCVVWVSAIDGMKRLPLFPACCSSRRNQNNSKPFSTPTPHNQQPPPKKKKKQTVSLTPQTKCRANHGFPQTRQYVIPSHSCALSLCVCVCLTNCFCFLFLSALFCHLPSSP